MPSGQGVGRHPCLFWRVWPVAPLAGPPTSKGVTLHYLFSTTSGVIPPIGVFVVGHRVFGRISPFPLCHIRSTTCLHLFSTTSGVIPPIGVLFRASSTSRSWLVIRMTSCRAYRSALLESRAEVPLFTHTPASFGRSFFLRPSTLTFLVVKGLISQQNGRMGEVRNCARPGLCVRRLRFRTLP